MKLGGFRFHVIISRANWNAYDIVNTENFAHRANLCKSIKVVSTERKQTASNWCWHKVYAVTVSAVKRSLFDNTRTHNETLLTHDVKLCMRRVSRYKSFDPAYRLSWWSFDRLLLLFRSILQIRRHRGDYLFLQRKENGYWLI